MPRPRQFGTFDPAAEFTIAINSYRQSGGSNCPRVTGAPVVYNAQLEVRQR